MRRVGIAQRHIWPEKLASQMTTSSRRWLGGQDDDGFVLNGCDGLIVGIDPHVDERPFAGPRVEPI